VIVNGHGASNQMETLERLARYYSHTTDALVVWKLALPLEVSEKNQAGHADLVETSLMMFYEKELLSARKLVDLSTLPPRGVPIHYRDFSIVDGPGFSGKPSPDKVTATDPREATAEKGGQLFEETVRMYLQLAEEALRRGKP
jgi:creatinine amidohydrolase/Fe(II)-dependent formamide hydrolase-like protein